MGITVLPPSVNSSAHAFTAVGKDIRFGLGAIRNVGANVVSGIIAAREEKGEFTSFQDFLDKVPAPVCNKRTIESLIKAGAFDGLGHSRRALLVRSEEAVDAVVDVKRNEAIGQFDLFGGPGAVSNDFNVEIPDLPEFDKKEKLAFEREMLGLYVSDHPLAGLEHILQASADCSIAELLADETRAEGSIVTVAGLLSSVQRRISKAGNQWALATVEDLDGGLEVLFFGETFVAYDTTLIEDNVVSIKGRLRRRDDSVQIQAMEVSLPDVVDLADQPVTIALPVSRCVPPIVRQLKNILGTHPGATEVRLRLTQPGRATVMKLDDSLRITPSPALFGDLKALLGPQCLAVN